MNENSEAIECLCVEVESKNSKNILLNLVYRPPHSDRKEFQNYFRNNFFKQENKDVILTGDFNINVLYFNDNKAVQDFINQMFCYSMVPTFNKPTRVTKKSISAIDHFFLEFSY